jgi:hypothetical protein
VNSHVLLLPLLFLLCRLLLLLLVLGHQDHNCLFSFLDVTFLTKITIRHISFTFVS